MYYVWKKSDGTVSAYTISDKRLPEPAILVGKEEFESVAGKQISSAPVEPFSTPDPEPTMSDLTKAVFEGVNSV